MKHIPLVFLITAMFVMGSTCVHADISNVYLTYTDDPTTSITFNFHTEYQGGSWVYLDTEPRDSKPDTYAQKIKTDTSHIEALRDFRTFHRATVTGLQPDTTYYFMMGDELNEYSMERKFRTLPADAPVRFVTGGDMNVGLRARALLRVAASQEPYFGLVGGDIAYVNGDLTRFETWDAWFLNWGECMITPSGYTVPMVIAIGNHETNNLDSPNPADRAPFFYAFFAHQGDATKTFHARQFGKNLAIFALDSGHIFPHAGEQSEWLQKQFDKYSGITNKVAVYHVPLYPSHRAYEGSGSQLGRDAWGPLFDANGLDVAFENHDHTFKRSKRLLGNEINPDGVLYLGDGCFGVDPRTVDAEMRWYLDRAESKAHVWVVDTDSGGMDFKALDEEGEEIDRYSLR